MATQELVTAGSASPFAVLRMESGELEELIRENLGGERLSPRDLDRVKVPAGGGTTWEVPGISGDVATKVIRGVIVYKATRRAYWRKKFEGGGEQPDCFSDDGMMGIGEPGGPCSECPYNEFQSAADGISKACKEIRQLFVLPEDSLLPIVINIPPGSLANIKAYLLRLLRAQLQSTDVLTLIGLEKATSRGGIDYSRVTFAAGSQLSPDAAALLRVYAGNLQPAFQAAARVLASDLDDDE